MNKLYLTGFLMAASLPAAAANEPFVVGVTNQQTPFSVLLPTTTTSGEHIKTVTIESIAVECTDSTGNTNPGTVEIGGNFRAEFRYYFFPFQSINSSGMYTDDVFAERTLIFADPGASITLGLNASMPRCAVTYSGHLE
jgi:hypothetical protein